MIINKTHGLSLTFLVSALFSMIVLSETTHNKTSTTIENPWSPQAPPSAIVRAGYFSIINQSESPVALTKVTSSLFEKIDMHQSIMESGIMSMDVIDNVTIEAKKRFDFSPGGFHLMMRNLKDTRSTYGSWPITLHFSNGETVSFFMPVRKANGDNRITAHHD